MSDGHSIVDGSVDPLLSSANLPHPPSDSDHLSTPGVPNVDGGTNEPKQFAWLDERFQNWPDIAPEDEDKFVESVCRSYSAKWKIDFDSCYAHWKELGININHFVSGEGADKFAFRTSTHRSVPNLHTNLHRMYSDRHDRFTWHPIAKNTNVQYPEPDEGVITKGHVLRFVFYMPTCSWSYHCEWRCTTKAGTIAWRSFEVDETRLYVLWPTNRVVCIEALHDRGWKEETLRKFRVGKMAHTDVGLVRIMIPLDGSENGFWVCDCSPLAGYVHGTIYNFKFVALEQFSPYSPIQARMLKANCLRMVEPPQVLEEPSPFTNVVSLMAPGQFAPITPSKLPEPQTEQYHRVVANETKHAQRLESRAMNAYDLVGQNVEQLAGAQRKLVVGVLQLHGNQANSTTELAPNSNTVSPAPTPPAPTPPAPTPPPNVEAQNQIQIDLNSQTAPVSSVTTVVDSVVYGDGPVPASTPIANAPKKRVRQPTKKQIEKAQELERLRMGNLEQERKRREEAANLVNYSVNSSYSSVLNPSPTSSVESSSQPVIEPPIVQNESVNHNLFANFKPPEVKYPYNPPFVPRTLDERQRQPLQNLGALGSQGSLVEDGVNTLMATVSDMIKAKGFQAENDGGTISPTFLRALQSAMHGLTTEIGNLQATIRTLRKNQQQQQNDLLASMSTMFVRAQNALRKIVTDSVTAPPTVTEEQLRTIQNGVLEKCAQFHESQILMSFEQKGLAKRFYREKNEIVPGYEAMLNKYKDKNLDQMKILKREERVWDGGVAPTGEVLQMEGVVNEKTAKNAAETETPIIITNPTISESRIDQEAAGGQQIPGTSAQSNRQRIEDNLRIGLIQQIQTFDHNACSDFMQTLPISQLLSILTGLQVDASDSGDEERAPSPYLFPSSDEEEAAQEPEPMQTDTGANREKEPEVRQTAKTPEETDGSSNTTRGSRVKAKPGYPIKGPACLNKPVITYSRKQETNKPLWMTQRMVSPVPLDKSSSESSDDGTTIHPKVESPVTEHLVTQDEPNRAPETESARNSTPIRNPTATESSASKISGATAFMRSIKKPIILPNQLKGNSNYGSLPIRQPVPARDKTPPIQEPEYDSDSQGLPRGASTPTQERLAFLRRGISKFTAEKERLGQEVEEMYDSNTGNPEDWNESINEYEVGQKLARIRLLEKRVETMQSDLSAQSKRKHEIGASTSNQGPPKRNRIEEEKGVSSDDDFVPHNPKARAQTSRSSGNHSERVRDEKPKKTIKSASMSAAKSLLQFVKPKEKVKAMSQSNKPTPKPTTKPAPKPSIPKSVDDVSIDSESMDLTLFDNPELEEQSSDELPIENIDDGVTSEDPTPCMQLHSATAIQSALNKVAYDATQPNGVDPSDVVVVDSVVQNEAQKAGIKAGRFLWAMSVTENNKMKAKNIRHINMVLMGKYSGPGLKINSVNEVMVHPYELHADFVNSSVRGAYDWTLFYFMPQVDDPLTLNFFVKALIKRTKNILTSKIHRDKKKLSNSLLKRKPSGSTASQLKRLNKTPLLPKRGLQSRASR